MKLWIAFCFILVTALASMSSAGTKSRFSGPANRNGGHATGNGGGVICINGKCETLIDAGLRVLPEFDGVWIPTNDHYTIVKDRITNGLHIAQGLQADTYYRIFGRADHFRKVEVVDSVRLELIKQRYLEVANKSGFPMDPATFEVVAFSSDDTIQPALTYLLPKFFELSIVDQSKILIHEGLYRGQPSGNLRFVLQLENAIHTVLEAKTNCVSGMTDMVFQACINEQIITHQLGLMPRENLIGALFSMVSDRLDNKSERQSTFPLERFGTTVSMKAEDGTLNWFFEINPQKILELARFEPRLPYIFSQVNRIPLKDTASSYQTENLSIGLIKWDKSADLTFLSNCNYTSSRSYTCTRSALDSSQLKLMLPH